MSDDAIRSNAEPSSALWDDGNLRDPHASPDKASRVRAMFAAIAPSYDLNNRVHSLGRDQAWRRKAVRMAAVRPSDVVVDVACGTGDLSQAFAAAGPQRVIGIDFTFDMLGFARDKASGRGESATRTPLAYGCGDAMRLPLADCSVDIVSIAFGIRNVAEPAAAMREFHRVLRPGGRVVVLEFDRPRNALLRRLYMFYFNHVLPRTATWLSGDRTGAYRYLPKSVNTFISREGMMELMQAAGFEPRPPRALTFGIAVCYLGMKPS